ncbi:50S ribosome-binding GTPase [bacterium]|nr:50S ribosome-binding GTPase [bacterium]
MNMLEKINRFVDVCLDNQSRFEAIKRDIDDRDQKIRSRVERFSKEAGQAMSVSVSADEPELRQFCEKIRERLQKLLEGTAADLENTRKSMKFIKDYEQSFNVAVFGKVKAGKSYLGNFIMGNRFREMGLKTSYDRLQTPPRVEVYDRGKVTTKERLEELDKDSFYVDATEATSTIQLFRLGALAWFDTPGIGSVTWENEMLAKEYVKNADLVVYTCNSDAAGTQQDFKEMLDLYRMEKPFLLLITQSDTVEEDYNDETDEVISVLVPKSKKDRQDQENYLRSVTGEQGIKLKDSEILTLSAKLALEGLKTDNGQMFADSHMGDFLDVLVGIMENEAAEFKRKTPTKRLNNAIDQIGGKLKEAEKALRSYGEDLAIKERKLAKESDSLIETMKLECYRRVDNLIQHEAGKLSSGGKAMSGAELSKAISNTVYEVLLNNCLGVFADSANILSNYTDKLSISGVEGLTSKKDSFSYEVKYVGSVERSPSGLFETVCGWFGKTYYRDTVKTKTETVEIDLGVYTRLISGQAREQVNAVFAREIPGMMKKIGECYLAESKRLLSQAIGCIQSAAADLQKLRIG